MDGILFIIPVQLNRSFFIESHEFRFGSFFVTLGASRFYFLFVRACVDEIVIRSLVERGGSSKRVHIRSGQNLARYECCVVHGYADVILSLLLLQIGEHRPPIQ